MSDVRLVPCSECGWRISTQLEGDCPRCHTCHPFGAVCPVCLGVGRATEMIAAHATAPEPSNARSRESDFVHTHCAAEVRSEYEGITEPCEACGCTVALGAGSCPGCGHPASRRLALATCGFCHRAGSRERGVELPGGAWAHSVCARGLAAPGAPEAPGAPLRPSARAGRTPREIRQRLDRVAGLLWLGNACCLLWWALAVLVWRNPPFWPVLACTTALMATTFHAERTYPPDTSRGQDPFDVRGMLVSLGLFVAVVYAVGLWYMTNVSRVR